MKTASLFAAVSIVFAGFASAKDAFVDLTFVGDVMVAEKPGEIIEAGGDPLAAVAKYLGPKRLRIANLECVVATTGTAEIKPFTFRAHPRTIPYLARYFDGVSVANNHSGDFGKDALAEQFGLLDAAKFPYFGGGRDLAAAHEPWIVERNGLRIALLGYVEFKPRSFEASATRPGVAWSGEDEQVLRDIRAARDEHHADIVIPFLHWGWEDEGYSSERQRVFSRRMIDAGATMVVGSHPHVTQGAESYQGKPIVYSLGNFLFNGFDTEATLTGWLLEARIGRNGVQTWRTRVVKLNADGVPTPDKRAASPCGDSKSDEVRACSGK
ncbi:MAG TPA: CapA family protein [Steroidobacteraceae bacterium]|nr:CapA family protein [Steroidobacteraceae bacterium]